MELTPEIKSKVPRIIDLIFEELKKCNISIRKP
jgi:hypothetical protein